MPVVARENGMRVAIWPNDHRPPHVHVFGAGWTLRVLIGEAAVLDVVEGGKPNSKQVAAAVALVAEHLEAANEMWREIHG